MKKTVIRVVSYLGLSALIALMLALSSGKWMYLLNYFIISVIISFSIGLCEEILFRLVIKFSPETVRIKAISVTIGVVGALLGMELAIILMRYTLHVIIFKTLAGHLILLLVTLIIGLVISFIMTYYRFVKYKLQEREMEIEHLKRLETESKYTVLQSKVNPHFLFNTLSTMAGMVYKAPEKAEKMILALSSLYRMVLNLPENGMVTLEEELKIVKEYLEIEEMRMGERLNYHISIDDDILYCKIPPMIVEMIVENAIIHGIAPKKEGGIVNIKAEKRGNIVSIAVEDNGIGVKGQIREGFALTNIKNRLKVMVKGGKLNIQVGKQGVKVAMELVCENENGNR